MKYSRIPLAQTVIKLCEIKNIKHIIISPGSRNAPLTIGLTNNSYFTCYSIVDERCAAFFALGIAQQLGEPTALVCTSGSALLNYYPAIAEAYYSNIPLIVLSADRPKHMIGIGDGQTINQKAVFKNHILYSANLKLDLDENSSIQEELPIFKNLEDKVGTILGLKQSIQSYNEEEINKAINNAFLNNGPVHINIPFNEPLYDMVKEPIVNPQNQLLATQKLDIETSVIEDCVNKWQNASKKMVLVGVSAPNKINQRWLDVLGHDNSVVVFTETTSNLHQEDFFPNIDKILASLTKTEFKNLQPDILLTFGGLIVSKKIKAFLRTYKPKEHWHIDLKQANDTFFSLNKFIQSSPNYFLEKLLNKSKSRYSDYKPIWKTIKIQRERQHNQYLNSVEFSDLKVFEIILKAIPSNTILQLGNSSTIRYVQLFNLNKTLEVFCNRGTSGIDGSTSTAIGCATANTKQTTLISGDLSFIYDSNALWNNYIPNNFRIIVINNQGGGIFRILPGHKNTKNFDTYFETKHELTAKHLCKMYSLDYVSVSQEPDLRNALKTFYLDGDHPKLLEIFTPAHLNDEVLLKYFTFLTQK